jgi:single-strand DNA-binding protein
MNTLNQIIIEGTVSTKPEPTKDVYTFGIACDRYYKGVDGEEEKETSYFDVVTYRALAYIANKQCQVGRGVRIVGRLKQTQWTDSDGKKWSKVVVIAEHIEFKPMAKAAI